MLKSLIKSLIEPSGKLYKILSYLYNYSEKSYLPKKVDGLEIILENISQLQSTVSFIQVGSNDGISGDPIHKFINKYHWEGVLIEPIPFLFEKLKTNYADKKDDLHFLNIAVSAEDAPYKILYAINEKYRDKVPDWYFQLATFNKEVLFHHDLPNIEQYITSFEVPVSSIQKIINTYTISDIDFLHIDAEGYDLEILKTLDFDKNVPKVILVEYIHLNVADRKNMIKLLKQNQYKIYRCDNDFLSLHNSVRDIYFNGATIFPFWE